jgi:RimJ/RimL family protein N-acetyltransferase
MIEEDPAQQPWLNRAIIRRHDGLVAGYISFHHSAPDPQLLEYADHGAELGYMIEPEFRRNGYASESAVAMMNWASREHGVKTFFLSISPSNEPSMKMAQAMGFRKVGEHIDEIDGLEFVLKACITEIVPLIGERHLSPSEDKRSSGDRFDEAG